MAVLRDPSTVVRDRRSPASGLAKQALDSGEQAVRAGQTHVANTIGGTVDFSEEVLESVEAGQRAAIDAVRGFVDTVDRSLPFHGEDASKRQQVIDAGLEMADRLVQAQYGFLRSLVHTAGETVRRPDDTSGDTGGS